MSAIDEDGFPVLLMASEVGVLQLVSSKSETFYKTQF